MDRADELAMLCQHSPATATKCLHILGGLESARIFSSVHIPDKLVGKPLAALKAALRIIV